MRLAGAYGHKRADEQHQHAHHHQGRVADGPAHQAGVAVLEARQSPRLEPGNHLHEHELIRGSRAG
ncbi:MAG: hypothetical protein WKG07_19305 [Hymenobacter sp.]